MDDRSFDQIVAHLAADPSRRGLLRLLASSGIAALLGQSEPVATGAKKKGGRKKKKKGCNRSQKKCGKRCISKANCCTADDCNEGDACLNGRCGDCASTADCPAPPTCRRAVCEDGRCGTELLPAGAPCDDEQFCTIGTACTAGGDCRGGSPRDCDDGIACTVDDCDTDAGACTHAGNDGACITTNSCRTGRCAPSDPESNEDGCVFDPINDGSLTCGTGACERTVQRCAGGEEQACVPGTPTAEVCDGIDNDCDGVIDNGFNFQSDPDHCGDCATRCEGDLACIQGECRCASNTQCGNRCVDTANDDNHCGDCATQCNGDLNCIGGVCGCISGTRCGNRCVDTQTDADHCGACNQPCQTEAAESCGATGSCYMGACERYGPETVCRPASCSSETLLLSATCDGQGICPPSGQVTCADGLTCRNGACRCPVDHDDCGSICCDPGQICASVPQEICCLPPGGIAREDEHGCHNEDCCSTTVVWGASFDFQCTCCAPNRGTAAPGENCRFTSDCCYGTCRGGKCSCANGATTCDNFQRCDAQQACYCMNSTAHATVCIAFPQGVNRCIVSPICEQDSDCEPGSICVDDPCCRVPICEPQCQQTET